MRLILSRKEGEEIVVGPPEAPLGLIRIGETTGGGKSGKGKTKLHFDFLPTIEVNRREIAEKKAGKELPPFGDLATN